MFVTRYNYVQTKPVELSDELITEQTGYMSTKEQVERLLLAGERLDAYRHGILDEYDDVDDDEKEAENIYDDEPVHLQERSERLVERLRYRSGEKTQEEPKEPVVDNPQASGEVSQEVTESPSKSDL